MGYDYFKQIRFRCNHCKDVVISNSNTTWSECSCGQLQVLGKDSFIKINGDDYTDMSIINDKYNHKK